MRWTHVRSARSFMVMKLYFNPLACSLSSRIASYETGVDLELVEVDPKTKKVMADGSDYHAVNPLGRVPALRLDDGAVITENAAILQYIAERGGMMPTDLMQRTRLRQWLSFVGTELHKSMAVLLSKTAGAETRAYATKNLETTLAWLDAQLVGREFLLDQFSVADGYLATVLNWTRVTPIRLETWPNVNAYFARVRERPSVKRAMADELVLYQEELSRHAS